MLTTITVEGKVIGQRKPAFVDWSVALPSGVGDRLRLRDLVTRLVLEEVDAFQQRQEERRLTQILSKAQIERAASTGKVDMGGREATQTVDPQAAVDAALQAFEDGLYFVFVNGEQQPVLDAELLLGSDSRVLFLRLTPLAGG